jgi:hypothetical protein
MSTMSNTGAGAALGHETIAQRAYQLYLGRGCAHGADLDDWLTAESQLLHEFNHARSSSPRHTSRTKTKGQPNGRKQRPNGAGS